MTQTVTAISRAKDSRDAGAELGRTIRTGFQGAAADAVIVFASAQHDYPALLSALAAASGTSVIAGSSSAGEFAGVARGDGCVSALALRSESMQFAVSLGRNVSSDPKAAAHSTVANFKGNAGLGKPHRAALVMIDALAGHSDLLVEQLTVATGGNYSFFGGGAGDDARFQKTHVFAGTEAATDAVAALEILSDEPLGVGVAHGWVPGGGPALRVTEADGMRLIGINGMPAIEAFEDHARATGQTLDRANALSFFLYNIIGIETDSGYRLRAPLSVDAEGAIGCAAAIPVGSVVRIMKTTVDSSVKAAEHATRSAIKAMAPRKPAAALVFDCVATRLRLGQAFDDELKACSELLQPVVFVGCNTYGQVARAEGQFGGFHNCTAVVCALPD